MSALIDQSGLVEGSDYLSLSRTMAIRGKFLVDTITGAQHTLHHKAVKSISLLEQPIPFELWRQYNRRLKVNEDNLTEIILFLNSIGGLVINRSKTSHTRITYRKIKWFTKGQMSLTLARRWPANLISIILVIVSTMRPLMLAVFLIAILAYGANVAIDYVVLSSISFLLIIWTSTVIHEQTHNYILSKFTNRKILLQRGLRLGILHKQLSTKVELASALLGPIAGVLASLSLGIILEIFLPRPTLFISIGTLVALFHLVSLLPTYGDGRVVRDKLKGIL